MQPEKSPAGSNYSLIADLYQRYGPALLMYICRQVPHREDAEDVLLEVFQAAVESETLASLDESKHRAWLWTVARRKVTDHYRRLHYRPLSSALEESEDALSEDDRLAPEAVAVRRETYAELRTHVSSLPELQQEILRLRFAYGLRCSEIARRLNRSSSAVRVMLSRSLNLLRDLYQYRKEDQINGR
jgi:RNA polymerase sigma-70 factor (ECF subfamily)